MNLNKKLKIGALDYKLIFTDPKNIEGSCGEHNIIDQEIRINDNMSGEVIELTIWHEVAHAWNSDWSEELVDNITQMICTVIRDNELYK